MVALVRQKNITKIRSGAGATLQADDVIDATIIGVEVV